MLSRRSANLISLAYSEKFLKLWRSQTDRYAAPTKLADLEKLYDFLYVENYSPWFCNVAKKVHGHRGLIEFVMQIHTGESLIAGTKDWNQKSRERLGQEYLENLPTSILNAWESEPSQYLRGYTEELQLKIVASLELDGYRCKDGRLFRPEQDVLDVEEESGVLAELYGSLRLGEKEVALHHLKLSEEHYLAKRWDDSISNSRKFLECTLASIAQAHSASAVSPMSGKSLERPTDVRDYLERAKLIELREKEALAKVYGLLSHTGGHPYMADNDQARLLRHMALTLTQFSLLRYQGSKAATAK